MEFSDFLEKQDEVYGRFRDTSGVNKGGVEAHDLNGKGVYIIAFRHPEEVAQRIEAFSRRIADTIPVLP